MSGLTAKTSDFPLWQPLPCDETLEGCHHLTPSDMMGRLMGNIGPVWNDLFGTGAEAEAFMAHAGRLSSLLDGREWSLLDALDDPALWDLEALEKSGRTRPSVRIDAHMTSYGHLTVQLTPGRGQWRGFPAAPIVKGRPFNELAYLTNVSILFDEPNFRRPQRTPLQAMVDRDLSAMLLHAWRTALRRIDQKFDVELNYSVEARFARRRPGREPELAGLVREFGRPLDPSLKAGKRPQRRERKKPNAIRSLASMLMVDILSKTADPNVLATTAEKMIADGAPAQDIADLMNRSGFGISPDRVEVRLTELVRALDVADPEWRLSVESDEPATPRF